MPNPRNANRRASSVRKAPSPTEIGYVDTLIDGRLVGWAGSLATPENPVSIFIFIDGLAVDNFMCDTDRPDVLAAGFPSARVGFEYRIPARFRDDQQHTLSLRFSSGIGVLVFSNLGVNVGEADFTLSPRPAIIDGIFDDVSHGAIHDWVLRIDPDTGQRTGGTEPLDRAMLAGWSGHRMVDLTLPEVIEPEIYRQRWPDLRAFSQDALYRHYATYGEGEGRQANRLVSRKDFIALIPPDSDTLEIGPYCNPLLTGPHVQYFDVLPTSALFTRAISMGVESPNVPTINFVSPTGDLSVVDRSFSYVVSSHCLEHQPNVISHLQEIERILSVQGRYFILVPDKRYCFDAFITESTVADVLDAHHTGRTTHALKSVIEHRALTTHNDSRRHWLGDHGSNSDNQPARIAAALLEYKKAAGSYIDVHAWYFTPRSALIIINTLQNLGYISLELERLYPTRKFSNEFWIVLRKPVTDGRK